ncbi:MAG: hypothetical protein ACR2MM_09415 [Flavobacteriaceae bacterium]
MIGKVTKISAGFKVSIDKSIKGVIPLWINAKQDYYYSEGLNILRRNNDEIIEKYAVDRSLLEKLIGWNALARRVLRMEIGMLVELPNGNQVAVKRKAIITRIKGSEQFKITHKIDRGSRPLNLCLAGEKVYWGEYFGNPLRDEVYVYGSEDGVNWEIVYAFPPKSIRHIHGLFWDKYRNGIWILTGDSNSESGLWFTKDYFQSVELVNGGSQKARAVSIIMDARGLIVPMDSPKEKNFIQRYNPDKNLFVNLKALPGSAFNSYTNNSLSMISTVVEPSRVNKAQYAEIFASSDLNNWASVAKLYTDFWSSLSLKVFRYPEVIFVRSSDKDPDHFYLYCRGVRNFNNRMIVLKRNGLEACLSDNEVHE